MNVSGRYNNTRVKTEDKNKTPILIQLLLGKRLIIDPFSIVRVLRATYHH